MTISKHGVALTTLDLWRQHAKPKHVERQWKTYYSAKEAARAWLAALPALPDEVTRVFATHDAFGPVMSWAAEPEVKMPFDDCGEARNSDLLVDASDRDGQFLVAVEAKAGESFGSTLASARKAAANRLARNDRSKGLERLDSLCAQYLGATLEADPTLGMLRYQLLTATAGALHVATRNGVRRVVFLIQDFASAETSHRKRTGNTRALDTFVARLTHGLVTSVADGCLVELPVHPPTAAGPLPRLFVAKVTRWLPLGLE